MPTYTAPGVYVEEVPSSQKVLSAAPTAIAAFVGFTQLAPNDDPNDPMGLKPRLVTSWSQYQNLYGDFVEGYLLPMSVYGYFANGGSIAYICRVPNAQPSGKPSTLELEPADRTQPKPLSVQSKEPDALLAVQIQSEDPPVGAPDSDPAPFTLNVVQGGKVVESYPHLTFKSDASNVATVVNAASKLVTVTVTLDAKADLTGQLEVLKSGVFALTPVAPTPVQPTGRQFAGSESARSGINGLAVANDVTMVIVPDLYTAAKQADGSYDLNLVRSVHSALISHCEQHGNRMAILDPPPGYSPQQMMDWRNATMYDSAFAALYYPWVKVDNPTGSNGNSQIFMPPSGHVAGLWARTDDSRGVWKAPANDTIRGVLDLPYSVTQNEQSLLNPMGINCIRPFGTRGIRVWGARTLASDSDWRYINVRRLFNMVETTILEGTQWAVFEPNDMTLWEGVKRTLDGFLRGLWSAGALFGATADQAFYVKCDAETNPPQSIDEGKLVVEVGIAPVKPAEFVIFRISQQKQTAA